VKIRHTLLNLDVIPLLYHFFSFLQLTTKLYSYTASSKLTTDFCMFSLFIPGNLWSSFSKQVIIFSSHSQSIIMAVRIVWVLIRPRRCSGCHALSSDPGFAGSNPAEDGGFLKVIKICSTTTFEGKVTPSVPYRKVLRHVKEPWGVWKLLIVDKIHRHFSPSFSWYATRFLC
jgi:hypothetical protein